MSKDGNWVTNIDIIIQLTYTILILLFFKSDFEGDKNLIK